MKDIDTVRREMKKAYRRLAGKGGWRAVGAEFGVDNAIAWRIVNEAGYEPTDPKIRVKLGLPAIVQVAACPVCGEVHLQKGCPHAKKHSTPSKFFDWPVERLRWALENREEMK